MNPPDLLPCYKRFHECVLTASRERPKDIPGLAPVEAQLHSRRQVRQWGEEVACFLNFLEKGDRILDFGSGSGLSGVPFAYAGCAVNSIDITQETPSSHGCAYDTTLYQDVSRQQRMFWPYLEKAFPGITFQHYKDAIPFPDQTFKAVMAFGVLEHIPRELHPAIIKELRRVLVPGGYLFIAYLPRKWAACEWIARVIGRYHHQWLWGDHDARKFLQDNGFDIRLFKRVVTAPQHPASFSNRFETLFNFIDRITSAPPLDLFSHHMRIVAQKR